MILSLADLRQNYQRSDTKWLSLSPPQWDHLSQGAWTSNLSLALGSSATDHSLKAGSMEHLWHRRHALAVLCALSCHPEGNVYRLLLQFMDDEAVYNSPSRTFS